MTSSIRFDYKGKTILLEFSSEEDHIAHSIMDSGTFYEREMLEALALQLRPGDLVVDAGANIGNHTVYFGAVCGCHVAAFEPVAGTFRLLERNVQLNALQDRVSLWNLALGEEAARARIASYDEGNIGATTLEPSADGDIEVATLDSLRLGGRVSLLKVDVEGMDLAVLRGAAGVLERDRPWVVCEAATDDAFKALRSFMSAGGFEVSAVYNSTDTYLFLPSRDEQERNYRIQHMSTLLMHMQRRERHHEARFEQVGRYAERLKREAIASSAESLAGARHDLERGIQEASVQGREVGEMFSKIDQALDFAIAGSRQLAGEVKAWRDGAGEGDAVWLSEIEDLKALHAIERQELEHDRQHAARESLELRADIVRLGRKQVELEGIVSAEREAVRKLRGNLASSAGELAALRERLAETVGESARKAGELGRQLDARTMQANNLARELRTVEKQVKDARRRLQAMQVARDEALRDFRESEAQRHEVERCLRRMQRARDTAESALRVQSAAREATRQELENVKASASYEIGYALISGLKTPKGILMLPWTLSREAWIAWKRRGGATRRVEASPDAGE